MKITIYIIIILIIILFIASFWPGILAIVLPRIGKKYLINSWIGMGYSNLKKERPDKALKCFNQVIGLLSGEKEIINDEDKLAALA